LKAIEHYQAALAIAREVQDVSMEALTLADLGDAYRRLGDTAEALKYLAQARRTARDLGYPLAEMGSLSFEGQVHLIDNDFVAAAARLRSAIDLADRSGAVQFQCEARVFLVWVYLCLDELALAAESARDATRFGYPRSKNKAFLALGVVALRRSDVSSAVSALQTALHHSDELLARNPRYADALETKGLALSALALCGNVEHLDAAKDAFEAARLVSSAPGSTKLLLQQFDALSRADKTGLLAPLRMIAAGEPGRSSAAEAL